MSKAKKKAEQIISEIEKGKSIPYLKENLSENADEWHRFSSKAYNLNKERAKQKRNIDEKTPNIICTSNDQIKDVLEINDIISDYALLLPIFCTLSEVSLIKKLISQLPTSENKIIDVIGNMTMHPRLRLLQQKGRIEKFEYFKPFTKLIHASTLSYFRENYISSYLTLIPVIEGIIIRWMGFEEDKEKPDFEGIRNFFKNSHTRQPSPTNILFHNVYAQACDKILNKHLFKPTSLGKPFADFNRHIASHLLNDRTFATKQNCIRLYILIDAMTEIFLYESKISDPRFKLTDENLKPEIEIYSKVFLSQYENNAENLLLNN